MVSCICCGISHKSRKRGIHFHRFPKSLEQRKAWLAFVNKDETSIPKNCYICSQHFDDNCFDRTSQSKIALRKNAVPTKVILRHKYARSMVRPTLQSPDAEAFKLPSSLSASQLGSPAHEGHESSLQTTETYMSPSVAPTTPRASTSYSSGTHVSVKRKPFLSEPYEPLPLPAKPSISQDTNEYPNILLQPFTSRDVVEDAASLENLEMTPKRMKFSNPRYTNDIKSPHLSTPCSAKRSLDLAESQIIQFYWVQKEKEHQQQLDSKQGLVLNDGASTSGQYPTTNPLHLDIKLEDTEIDIKDEITLGITNFIESVTIKSEDDSHVFDGDDDGYNINENDFSITHGNNQNVSTTSTSSQGTDLRSFITVIPQARESIMLGSVSSDAPVTHPPEKRRDVGNAESTSTSRKSDPKELHVPTNDLCVLCAKDISKIRRRFSVAQYSDIILVLTGVNVLDYEIPPNSCCSCFKAVANIKQFQKQVHEATDLLKRKLAVYAEKQFEFANVTPNFDEEPHLTAALMFDQEYCETPDVNMQEMQDSTIINAATLHASAVVPVVSTLEPPPLIFKAVFPFTKCDICGKFYKDLVNHNCHGKDVAEQPANVDVPLVAEENTRLMKVAADDVLKQQKLYKSSCTGNMRSYLSSTTQCKICGNQVRVPSLRFHMLNHRKTDEKAICSVCGKMYVKLSSLKKHEVVHGEKRHKCAICGQCFHYSKYLQRHLRSHSGEKAFACPYCDKTFSIICNLNQHKRLHTDEKLYKCELCSASFQHNATLKHHLSTSHTAVEIAGSGHKSSAAPNASGKSATDTSGEAKNCDNDISVVSNTESQEDNCDENVK